MKGIDVTDSANASLRRSKVAKMWNCAGKRGACVRQVKNHIHILTNVTSRRPAIASHTPTAAISSYSLVSFANYAAWQHLFWTNFDTFFSLQLHNLCVYCPLQARFVREQTAAGFVNISSTQNDASENACLLEVFLPDSCGALPGSFSKTEICQNFGTCSSCWMNVDEHKYRWWMKDDGRICEMKYQNRFWKTLRPSPADSPRPGSSEFYFSTEYCVHGSDGLRLPFVSESRT